METSFIKHGRMPTAQDYAEFQRGMEKLRQEHGRLTHFIQHVNSPACRDLPAALSQAGRAR